MINLQSGYTTVNSNFSKSTVGFGGVVPYTSTRVENRGFYPDVTGYFDNFINQAFSVVGRTSSGVLLDTLNGSTGGSLQDVTIANRTGATGLYAHIYIDDRDSYLASNGITNTPSGGLRLGAGESYKPDGPVSFIGVRGSGFNVDVYGRYAYLPNSL
jgi:hypothetical protein